MSPSREQGVTAPSAFERRGAPSASPALPASAEDDRATSSESDAIVVANEFAEVVVQRVLTHNGVRLEVSSPRLGRVVRLDPLQLEALTWQEAAAFSAMLIEPFGPSEGGPTDGVGGAPEHAGAEGNGRAHGGAWR